MTLQDMTQFRTLSAADLGVIIRSDYLPGVCLYSPRDDNVPTLETTTADLNMSCWNTPGVAIPWKYVRELRLIVPDQAAGVVAWRHPAFFGLETQAALADERFRYCGRGNIAIDILPDEDGYNVPLGHLRECKIRFTGL